MRQTIDWAIVIPTLNEEKYIGSLLDSIALQTVQPKEVAVVDAFSEDKTKYEVEKRQKNLPQLKFYQVKKSSISKQRNFGAEKTTASHLLFLDADMVLASTALEAYDQEVEKKHPDVAAAINRPLSDDWRDKFMFEGMDLSFKALKPIWPMAQGMNMYFRRDSFEKNHGFDEEITVGEDHELVQRICKNGGKFVYLNKPKVFTSIRRMKKVGRVRFALMMTASLLFVVFFGYKKNPITEKYEFGNHQE